MTTPDPNEAHNLAEGLDRERGASWIFSSRAAHQLRAMADENVRLTGALKKANDQAEHFEREWYLRGDELERLRSDVTSYVRIASEQEQELERLRAQVASLSREAWTWSKALEAQLSAQPVATLHDDGYFTWKSDKFRLMYGSDYAGWRMDVFASPIAPAQQPESKPDQETAPSPTVGDERGLALWQLIYGAIAHEPLPLKVGQIERAAKRVEDMLKRRAAAQAEPVAWAHVFRGQITRTIPTEAEARSELERLNREYPRDAQFRSMRPLVYGDASNPPAQWIDEREAFATWANRAGYDTAHTYDTDRSRWVFFNPMTADLWAAWQARAALAQAQKEQA